MLPPAVVVVDGNPQGAAEPTGDCGWGSAPALTPVLDRPLIAHTLEGLATAGVERAVVAVQRAVADEIEEVAMAVRPPAMELTFARRDRGADLLRVVARARALLGTGPFVLRFADSIGLDPLDSQLDLRQELGEHDAVVLLSRGTEALSEHWLYERSQFQVGALLLGSGFPAALSEERPDSEPILDAALAELEGGGGTVYRRQVERWWRGSGGFDSVLEANRFMLGALPESDCEAQLQDSDLSGAVHCDPSARIQSSVLRGPALIGAEVELRDAFVGPFSTVGTGVTIEAAEIENSVILEGSSISHVGQRLDSSVIGPHARIAKDFRIPRGTRINVGPGSEISLE